MTKMVLLGALIATCSAAVEAIEKALKVTCPNAHHKLLPQIYKALREGRSTGKLTKEYQE
jgi:hypothetical protein